MLLVMIALVVGSLLIAGFLATQGTAIGIARNQRDQDRAREVAESGIDLCVWLVKNRTDWRKAMAPGNWLANYSLAGGTVTVVAADGDNSGSFSDDVTQSVTFTSTGTVNGRTYTMAATFKPTGGGTPWGTGAFSNQSIAIKDTAVVDSFNSSVGQYAYTAAHNALFSTNSIATNALRVESGARYRGTFTAGPNASVGNVVQVVAGGVGPTNVAAANETRTIGKVITPNLTGFSEGGSYSKSGSITLATTNIHYDSFTLTNGMFGTTCRINHNAVYHIRGNMTVNSNATISVDPGYTVIFQVDGNVTFSGNLNPGTGAQVLIYCGGIFEAKGYSNLGNTASPGQLVILGMANCSSVYFHDYSTIAAAILAPNANIDITEDGWLFGSAVGNSLTVEQTALFHQDDALKTQKWRNMTAGSFAGDYSVRWDR